MFGSLNLRLPQRHRRVRNCGYCGYYPATERNGSCCHHCIGEDDAYKASVAAGLQEQARLEALQRAEDARKHAEKMVMYQKANVTTGKSFADCLKK